MRDLDVVVEVKSIRVGEKPIQIMGTAEIYETSSDRSSDKYCILENTDKGHRMRNFKVGQHEVVCYFSRFIYYGDQVALTSGKYYFLFDVHSGELVVSFCCGPATKLRYEFSLGDRLQFLDENKNHSFHVSLPKNSKKKGERIKYRPSNRESFSEFHECITSDADYVKLLVGTEERTFLKATNKEPETEARLKVAS